MIGNIQAVANALTPPVDTSDMKKSIEAVAKAFTTPDTPFEVLEKGIEDLNNMATKDSLFTGAEQQFAAALLLQAKQEQADSDARMNMMESIRANAKAFTTTLPYSDTDIHLQESAQDIAKAFTTIPLSTDLENSIPVVSKAFTGPAVDASDMTKSIQAVAKALTVPGPGPGPVVDTSDMTNSIKVVAKALTVPIPGPGPGSAVNTSDMTKSIKAVAKALSVPAPGPVVDTSDMTNSIKAVSKALTVPIPVPVPAVNTSDMTKSIKAVAKALSIPVPAPPPPPPPPIAVNTSDMAKSIKAVTKALTTPVVDTSSMVKSIQAVAKALATSISSSSSSSSGTSTSSNYDIPTDGFIIVDNKDDIPLKYVHLTKPIKVSGQVGIITDVYKKKGDTIRPGDPIMKIGATVIHANATTIGVIESIAEKDATLVSADTVYTYNPADNIEVSKYKYDGTNYEPDI
jgi:hypothetical protein